MLSNKCRVNAWTSEVHMLYTEWDLLAATCKASAFVLIGSAVQYTGVCTWAESVCQKCVLGRCANLCSIIVLQESAYHQSYMTGPSTRTRKVKVTFFTSKSLTIPQWQDTFHSHKDQMDPWMAIYILEYIKLPKDIPRCNSLRDKRELRLNTLIHNDLNILDWGN